MTAKQKAEILAKLISDKDHDQRDLWLFGGIEPIAYFEQASQKWFAKTGDCNRCGKCCIGADVFNPGPCQYLGRDSCLLRSARPFCCCVADGRGRVPDCSVRYAEVD